MCFYTTGGVATREARQKASRNTQPATQLATRLATEVRKSRIKANGANFSSFA